MAAGPDRAQQRAETSIGWRMAGLGMQTSSEVVAGALIGWAVDRWLGSSPTGLLIGGIAGIAVGLTTLIRGAMRANRELDAARRGSRR
ncbi:MAG: AtpZ/AtpI family protein [Phycisphaerales bacterium]|nr:AtpZ/AtpI family protein [Phycisphaerales bacterium]